MTAPMPAPHLGDDRLDDFVDGVLEPSAQAAASAHLAGCAACTARLDELRALLALSAGARHPVEPPAELWPLVVASTSEWPTLRRRVLRSMNGSLAAAALVLVLLTALTTTWLTTRVPIRESSVVAAVPAILRDDAQLDGALAARDHPNGPIARQRISDLRERLGRADAALRVAPDDEALYRALADRERVVKEIRSLLGAPPVAPRPPLAP